MHKIILFFLLNFLVIVSLKAQKDIKIDKESLYGFLGDIDDSLKANLPLPNFCVTGNKLLTNDSLQGYVTFIDLWVSHCSPCVAECYAMNLLYNKFKGYPKFKFISITPDTDKTIKEFVAEHNLQFPIYRITKENSLKLNMGSGFPTKILVRADGKIEKFVSGGATDSEIANEIIKQAFYSKLDFLLVQH